MGHQAGDELLQPSWLSGWTRLSEQRGEIGRLGGDEFQIMLPDYR